MEVNSSSRSLRNRNVTEQAPSSVAQEIKDPKPGTSKDAIREAAQASTVQGEFPDDDDTLDDIILIDDIKEYNGISDNDIKKLKDNGFYTVDSVANVTKRRLLQINGFSEAKVANILKATRARRPLQLTTAAEVMRQRADLVMIKTGSLELDKILGGGVETGSITELVGEFRTGKTQLCHSLAVTCQLPTDQGGGEGKCAYLDTEGDFRSERLVSIAEKYGLQTREMLENILYARVYNTDHLMETIDQLNLHLSKTRYALVVVDSSTSLFRAEFSGRGELNERQILLNKLLTRLKKLCSEFGVSVVITNQVVADVSGANAGFLSDPKKPIGGHVLAHAVTTRLTLKKGRNNLRICKVTASPHLPEDEALFAITNQGIEDATEK